MYISITTRTPSLLLLLLRLASIICAPLPPTVRPTGRLCRTSSLLVGHPAHGRIQDIFKEASG